MSRIGVLISGRGSNLQALIDAESRDDLAGEIVIVISSKSNAMGLERATKADIATEVITKKSYPIREDHDTRLVEILKEHNVDLVVLAGYLRMFTDVFISEFKDRIINVHPSLLPSFKGVKAQWQAVDYGVRVSGCTTHFVGLEMDAGPIIKQKTVKVFPDDTGETLAERIIEEEHKLIVESVRLFCDDKLSIKGRLVVISK